MWRQTWCLRPRSGVGLRLEPSATSPGQFARGTRGSEGLRRWPLSISTPSSTSPYTPAILPPPPILRHINDASPSLRFSVEGVGGRRTTTGEGGKRGWEGGLAVPERGQKERKGEKVGEKRKQTRCARITRAIIPTQRCPACHANGEKNWDR